MSLAMSKAAREAFLADLHVGVLSLNRDDAGPLTAPIWYIYEDGVIWFTTGAKSRKGQLLKVGGRASMVSQTEKPPYQYVSVEGEVTEVSAADLERDIRPMAIRYLGEQQGNAYADNSSIENTVLVKIKPEKWLTVDYGKLGREG